jgi:hypothetical protein
MKETEQKKAKKNPGRKISPECVTVKAKLQLGRQNIYIYILL